MHEHAKRQARAPGLPPSTTRRYAAGVAIVALLGVAMLVGYVLWSQTALESALARSRDERALQAGAAWRDKLTRALSSRDPASPQVWASLDPVLEEALEGLPDLRGIVVQLPGGALGAVIGPSELRRAPFLTVPAGGGPTLRIDAATPERAEVTVAFHVPADRTPAAAVNVLLDVRTPGALGPSIGVLFRSGTVLVGIVIYFLAVLAFLIARHGARAAHREREKAVRLSAVGDVAGAIAHELRNPLNAINLSFQVLGESLRKSGAGEDRLDDVVRARGEVAKISRVVDNFVSFARSSEMVLSRFEVADVAREVMGRLSERCADAAVRPSVTVSGGTAVSGDREKIGQALSVTFQAAIDAVSDRPGTLDVLVTGAARDVRIRVSCRGGRVDSRRISNFTAARGAFDEPVGLALTMARTWIDLHGGAVFGDEPLPDRATFEIVLPKGVA